MFYLPFPVERISEITQTANNNLWKLSCIRNVKYLQNVIFIWIYSAESENQELLTSNIGCVNTLAFSCWQGKLTPHINTVMEQIWFAVAELTELCTAALEKKLIAAFSGSPISIIALFNRCDGGIFIWMQADLLGRVPDRHVNMTSPTKPGQSLFFYQSCYISDTFSKMDPFVKVCFI